MKPVDRWTDWTDGFEKSCVQKNKFPVIKNGEFLRAREGFMKTSVQSVHLSTLFVCGTYRHYLLYLTNLIAAPLNDNVATNAAIFDLAESEFHKRTPQ